MKNKEKHCAFLLYKNGYSIEEINKLINNNVTIQTLYAWKKEEQWEEKTKSEQNLITSLEYNTLWLVCNSTQAIVDERKEQTHFKKLDSKETDSLLKAVTAVERIRTPNSFESYLALGKEFTAFVSNYDPENKSIAIELMDSFIKHKANNT